MTNPNHAPTGCFILVEPKNVKRDAFRDSLKNSLRLLTNCVARFCKSHLELG